MKKNEVKDFHIIDMTTKGEGIAKEENFIYFIDNTIPGDDVRARITLVKKNYAKAEVVEWIRQSEKRIDPPCPHFFECGGCQIMNMDYQSQLDLKRKMVVDALERIGHLENADPLTEQTLGMERPYEYRNKAQYKISKDGRIGLYKKRSHEVVPIDSCLIQKGGEQETIKVLNQIIRELEFTVYDETTGKGTLRGIVERVSFATGERMFIFVLNKDRRDLAEKAALLLTEKLPNVASVYLNVNTEKTNRVLGRKSTCVLGKDKITDQIGKLTFEISPLSFFQVNPKMTEVIYDKVLEYAQTTKDKNIIDLYCGMGTIGLYIGEKAKQVYGIEESSSSIRDANKNAKRNNRSNATFIQGKVEEEMEKLLKEVKGDIVVLDPPRKGCDESLLNRLMESNVERVVYVSCNPATLARDLDIL
ncbi:MAG TPA: 23S rRNA (uracil(1939)-C(5))-methyltransferase RlmD, partial [Eubacteriaceae bacterium]|nr:23S rRNA (uracil(1939)-C(5))-methyltransferase RlmD [Eubacteriaceae bacterium]